MDVNNWLVFASIIGLASVSPGPNVLAVIVNTVEAGRRGALFTILGNLIALFTIALAAAIGVGTLLETAPSVFSAMKIAGGLYLAWMGFKMLKSSFSKLPLLNLQPNSSSPGYTTNIGYITRAMLISYSNPKSILFLSAVFPTFLNKSGSIAPQFAVMFMTIICVVFLIHGAYAALALRVKNGLVGTGARKLMARISGISFIGFGAGFVYDAQK